MSDVTCVRCGGTVPSADARACQHCGYDVSSHSAYRWLWGIAGLVLTVSIIGAPLGLPMLYKAYKHRKAYQNGVAR